MSDEKCRICGEPKSNHVATSAGPYTHPKEAAGEGTYRLVGHGTLGAMWPGDDDYEWEHWEFVPKETGNP